jgi:hypothetical protein
MAAERRTAGTAGRGPASNSRSRWAELVERKIGLGVRTALD